MRDHLTLKECFNRAFGLPCGTTLRLSRLLDSGITAESCVKLCGSSVKATGYDLCQCACVSHFLPRTRQLPHAGKEGTSLLLIGNRCYVWLVKGTELLNERGLSHMV